MNPNQRAFDWQAAEAARDEGVRNAAAGAGEDWLLEAIKAVRRIATAKPEFTTDDLWTLIDPPAEPRAAGAVMSQAKALGICEATDRTKKSARVRCHARPVRVWRSLVCSPYPPNEPDPL